MNYQKKLIQLFKSFVEKVFVPQIKKYDASLAEWSKFSTILNQEILNYTEIQSYIDSIGQISQHISSTNGFEKLSSPVFLKKQNDGLETQGFNATRTMGGEKTRLGIIQKLEHEEMMSKLERKQYGMKEPNLTRRNSQSVSDNQLLVGVDKVFRNFSDNHAQLQFILQNYARDVYIENKVFM